MKVKTILGRIYYIIVAVCVFLHVVILSLSFFDNKHQEKYCRSIIPDREYQTEECYTFFEDVCTVNELLSLSQRFEVAKMLRDQKTYLDIAEKTGASTATISRVNRSLNYGNDGYDMVFSRLQDMDKE